jgi:hypothetical protein
VAVVDGNTDVHLVFQKRKKKGHIPKMAFQNEHASKEEETNVERW